jgi:hypothetical protein
LALIFIAIGAIWIAKKRVVDHEKPRGDLRPNDRPPTAPSCGRPTAIKGSARAAGLIHELTASK